MKNKYLKIKIGNSMFKFRIIIIIADNLSKAVNEIEIKHRNNRPPQIKREFKKYYGHKIAKCNGITILDFENNKKPLIYIIIKRHNGSVDVRTITHEIFHLVGRIYKKVNIIYYEDEEAYANLDGELNSFVFSKLIEIGENLIYSENEEIEFKILNKLLP